MFNTAEGHQALISVTTGAGNRHSVGVRSLQQHRAASILALVLERWSSTTQMRTRPLALLPCYSMTMARRNTAVGAAAMVNNAGDVTGNGSFNDAVGAFALNNNVTGFSNNAMGDSALFRNMTGAANTAVGDEALENNDATAAGDANNNVAVGAQALFNNVNGSENTAVGSGAGPNLATGFNNTYIGNFVGSLAGTPDESSTIRIGDISNGNGAGSEACYIGGIWANHQPVGGTVVVVTLNTDTDELGIDIALGRSGERTCASSYRTSTSRAPRAPRTKPCSMTKLRSCKQRSRSNKQRSRSNRNK